MAHSRSAPSLLIEQRKFGILPVETFKSSISARETNMRKLVLLVCMFLLSSAAPASAGLIPSWVSPSGQFGFYPITNELSLFKNFDDSGKDRGRTVQIVMINSFTLITSFNFEFTGDFNFDLTPGLDRDHYVELSLVKPVTSVFSLNVQRVISTFEPEAVNQVGVRFSF
jgi:hypothetical protein